MAQEQQPQQPQEEQLAPLSTLYPQPPPFYKNFTKQNVNELRRLRKEAGIPLSGPSAQPQTNGDDSNGERKRDIDILSLPPELRYLIPPPPPADGTYTSFGQPKSLNPKDPNLADLDIEQLYPDHPSVHKNPQPHLIALARSLLTKYLHLLGVLSNNPEEYEQCTKELQTIVYNMHDLINKYRPQQARETLILMMEERVEKLRGEIRGIEDGAEKARELLKGFEGDAEKVRGEADGGLGASERGDAERDVEGQTKARQRRAWDMLDQEMKES